MTSETRKRLRTIAAELSVIAKEIEPESHDLGAQVQQAAWNCTDAVLTSEETAKKTARVA